MIEFFFYNLSACTDKETLYIPRMKFSDADKSTYNLLQYIENKLMIVGNTRYRISEKTESSVTTIIYSKMYNLGIPSREFPIYILFQSIGSASDSDEGFARIVASSDPTNLPCATIIPSGMFSYSSESGSNIFYSPSVGTFAAGLPINYFTITNYVQDYKDVKDELIENNFISSSSTYKCPLKVTSETLAFALEFYPI